jgi:hypothetical protein
MKTIELNLAELTPDKLISLLEKHNADQDMLYQLLDNLFEMWRAALHTSTTVIRYGEDHYPNFLHNFVEATGKQHGISPETLNMLLSLTNKHTTH